MSSTTLPEIESLPLSKELLEYYRKRLEQAEHDYAEAMKQIDSVKIQYGEKHQLEWELSQRSKEVQDLQKGFSDMQNYLYDERRQLLRVIAENDRLKIQELKDRKKIRYLLSIAKIDEDEVTYFKKHVDKRFVKEIEKTETAKKESLTLKEISNIDENLETDVDILRLIIKSLKAQLEEQTRVMDDQIKTLQEDRRLREQEFAVKAQRDDSKIEELLRKNQKIENILRENTRDLLDRKRRFQVMERKLKEEKTTVAEDIEKLKDDYEVQKVKNQNVERIVETKLKKKQEMVTNDLKAQVNRYETELKELRGKANKTEAVFQKKMDETEKRLTTVSANYNALKKRRQREVEGFTNDINLLRKQVQILENTLVKQQEENTDPLKDKELLLLNLARETGKKASRVTNELHNLKAKMYKVERDVRQLAF